jgi:hypothetical protein
MIRDGTRLAHKKSAGRSAGMAGVGRNNEAHSADVGVTPLA